jgi:hypothetical protein
VTDEARVDKNLGRNGDTKRLHLNLRYSLHCIRIQMTNACVNACARGRVVNSRTRSSMPGNWPHAHNWCSIKKEAGKGRGKGNSAMKAVLTDRVSLLLFIGLRKVSFNEHDAW